MAKKPETRFRSRIYPDLKSLPNTAIFPIQQRAIKGDPDIILCCNSMFVALELKDDSGELDALQEKKLDDITKAKGVALVVKPSNWKNVYALLMEIACSNIEIPANLNFTH